MKWVIFNVFTVNFEHLHLFQTFLLLTLNKQMLVGQSESDSYALYSSKMHEEQNPWTKNIRIFKPCLVSWKNWTHYGPKPLCATCYIHKHNRLLQRHWFTTYYLTITLVCRHSLYSVQARFSKRKYLIFPNF